MKANKWVNRKDRL